MKIVVICFSVNPMKLSASFRALKLIKYFQRLGAHVEVISSDNSYEVPMALRLVHHSIPYSPYLKNHNNFVGRVVRRALIYPEPEYYWVKSVIRGYLKLYQNNPPDAVFISTPPHSIQMAGVKINQVSGVPCISDLRDDWMTNHSLKFYTPLHKFVAKSFEKKMVRTCHSLILNTNEVSKRFQYRYPEHIGKFVTITNGYDEDDFAELEQFPKSMSFPKKNIIAYAGSGYGGYIGEILSKFCEDMRRIGLTKNWHIVTAGSKDLDSVGNEDVWTHLGLLSHREVSHLLREAKILFLPMFPGEKDDSGTVLLKTYGYLRSNSCIAYFGEKGSTPNLIKQFKGTFCFPRSDLDKFAFWLSQNQGSIVDKYERENITNFCFEVLARKVLKEMPMNY